MFMQHNVLNCYTVHILIKTSEFEWSILITKNENHKISPVEHPLYLTWLKNVANNEKSCKEFALLMARNKKTKQKNWDDKFRTNVPGVREQVLKICQILPS